MSGGGGTGDRREEPRREEPRREEPREQGFGLDPEGAPSDAVAGSPDAAADEDVPVVLRMYDEAFRAHADRVVLEDAGIDARVIDAVAGGLGLGPSARVINRIELLVRERDLDAAARLLDDNRRDSVDIDWDEVDVGEPADAVSRAIAGRPADVPGVPRSMPVPARIGWLFAAILLVVSLVLGVLLLGP